MDQIPSHLYLQETIRLLTSNTQMPPPNSLHDRSSIIIYHLPTQKMGELRNYGTPNSKLQSFPDRVRKEF